MFKHVNGGELITNSTSCNIVVNSMQLNLFFHGTFFNEFFTIATNDFTSPNFNDLKFTDTMIFRHPDWVIDLLKANKNVFELISVASSKWIPLLKQTCEQHNITLFWLFIRYSSNTMNLRNQVSHFQSCGYTKHDSKVVFLINICYNSANKQNSLQ